MANFIPPANGASLGSFFVQNKYPLQSLTSLYQLRDFSVTYMKFFLPHLDMNYGSLEPKVSVIPMSNADLYLNCIISRLGEFLVFDPIKIGDGGTYYCSARNEIGASDELSVTFDVFHPPKSVKTIPERKSELVRMTSHKYPNVLIDFKEIYC